MTAGLMEVVRPDLPTTPDLARMQRDRMAKVQHLMRAQGLDALVLLGNSNVAYVTGLGWPLSDSGRSTFERLVAVVTADDPVPHLFSPMRADDRVLAALPADQVPTSQRTAEGIKAFSSATRSDPVEDEIQRNLGIKADAYAKYGDKVR